MKHVKTLVSVFLVFVLIVLSACTRTVESGDSELVIGVEDITGIFNPLYAETEADRIISSQVFGSIQRQDTDNGLVNYCGGISYEYSGENQVKYTVTLRDDMFFSDGSHVTIDDVIFFYHLISDATYDGVYSDWYFNDIVGLKEYYYDDENYADSLAELENTVINNYSADTISKSDYIGYLIGTKLEGRFNAGLDAASPNGKTWLDYFESIGYAEDIKSLGTSPSEAQLLSVAARAEVENNPLSYNPQQYFREILMSEYLGSNYSDGIDVSSISGITKVNDYSCTILFNSGNINAISEINVPIVSKALYAVDYIKGGASDLKSKTALDIGSGPYKINKKEDGTVYLAYNEYYHGSKPDFTALKFTDLSKDGIDPVESIKKGDVDIISVSASDAVMKSLESDKIKTVISNKKSYVSVFFNTKTLDVGARKALSGLCNINNLLSDEIGRYYTAVYMPMSIRFPEYPSQVISPVYSENTFLTYTQMNPDAIKKISAYYCGEKDSVEYRILESLKKTLSDKGIILNIVLADQSELSDAIASGNADLWITDVYDMPTCDKYDYYNSNGSMNMTGISNQEIDLLTETIRKSTGFSDREEMTKRLLNLVMEQAVECPLYQLQSVTAYNTDKISQNSFGENFNYDGFTFVLPLLKKS